MKTLNDLPAGYHICVLDWGCHLEIDILPPKKADPAETRPEEKSDPMESFMTAAEAMKQHEKKKHLPSGSIKVDVGDQIWRVVSVHANQGWGPLLYDIAMELTTESNATITFGDSIVADEAKAVWQHYYEHRGDVKRTPLPKHLCWNEYPALCYSYSKAGSTISQLRKEKRLKEIDCSGSAFEG